MQNKTRTEPRRRLEILRRQRAYVGAEENLLREHASGPRFPASRGYGSRVLGRTDRCHDISELRNDSAFGSARFRVGAPTKRAYGYVRNDGASVSPRKRSEGQRDTHGTRRTASTRSAGCEGTEAGRAGGRRCWSTATPASLGGFTGACGSSSGRVRDNELGS